jgi:hypothetical protein
VTRVDADIDALKELREALVRFRYAQRHTTDRGDDVIELTRQRLAEKASRGRLDLEQCQAELEACRDRAAVAAADDDTPVDCSGCARAVAETEERLERILQWQERVEQEASAFRDIANRFRDLLDTSLPRTEAQLLAMIAGLEAARRVQSPGAGI